MKTGKIFLLLTIFVIVAGQAVNADFARRLSYQGRLTDTNGVPLADGSYDMVFGIYDAATVGTLIWSETHNSGTSQVTLTDGLFSVVLGGYSSLNGVSFNNTEYWVQVTVGATVYTPRQRLTMAPFAANVPDGSITATKLQDGAALNEILDDDGTGSGLDCDLLDGYDWSTIPDLTDKWVDEAGDTMAGTLDMGNNAILDIDWANSDDGIGSFLDADKLDGQEGSWYQRRVSGTCAVGNSIRVINSDGTVVCEADTDTTDHGTLTGRGDDDHTIYFHLSQNETVSGRPAFNGGDASNSPFTVDSTYKVTSLNADLLDGYHAADLEAVLDHGQLQGLGDDDHTQYFALSQNETVSGRPAFNGGDGSNPPFTVDSTYKVSNLNADLLDGYSSPQLGNFGNWQPHGTINSCNTDPSYWGWNYVQGTTSCPNATSSQWYRGSFSLGSNYSMRGAGGYSLEVAYPRYSHSSAGVWMRTVENGTIGGWTRIDGNNPSAGAWTLSGTDLYPDSTTYDVGIGNTNPSYKLDVTGTGRFTSSLYANTELYVNNWVRHSDNDGIYWSNNLWYIYPASAQDMRLRTGSGNGGIMGTIADATARGYVHWTTSNEIGFLNASRSWSLRMDNSKNAQIYGDLTVSGGDIFLTDTNTRLTEAGGNALRVQTNSGYLDMGPMNTSWAHFQTDRASFYFNPKITVDGNVEPYSDATRDLGSSTRRWRNIYLTGNIYDSGTSINDIYVNQSGDTMVGTLNMSGSTTRIDFSEDVEEKILLYGAANGAGTYSIGVEGSTQFYKSNGIYRWYIGENEDGGSSENMELDSDSLNFNNKEAIKYSDSWLRLNQAGDFTSGTHTPGNFYAAGYVRGNGGFRDASDRTVIDGTGAWHRSYGAAGWYNGTYGGGIYMTDSTYVRTYNNKPMRSDAGFYVGSSGYCYRKAITANCTPNGNFTDNKCADNYAAVNWSNGGTNNGNFTNLSSACQDSGWVYCCWSTWPSS